MELKPMRNLAGSLTRSLMVFATVGAVSAPGTTVLASSDPVRDGIEANRHGDYAKAYSLLKVPASQGVVAAETTLGEMFYYGHGVPQNDKTAFKLISAAAQSGDPVAEELLGHLYLNGRGVESDQKKVLFYWHAAAEAGNPDAQFRLGELVWSGSTILEGPEPTPVPVADRKHTFGYDFVDHEATHQMKQKRELDNEIEGNMWFILASAQGHKDAHEHVKDLRGAGPVAYAQWVVSAAQHRASQWQETHPRTYSKAILADINGADRGAPGRQFALGTRFQHGDGVVQSFVSAHKWYNLAAMRGNERAKVALDSLQNDMISSDVQEAQDAANAWWTAHEK